MRYEKSKRFKTIPGIGVNMEQRLFNIGIKTIEDLVGEDPEELYLKDTAFNGRPADRCVLYVFRLAVYLITTSRIN